MDLLDALIVIGMAIALLAAAGGMLIFTCQIWRCSLAAAKGGGSRRRAQSTADDESYRIARSAYLAHRDRAGRGMIILFLGIFIGIGFGLVGDRKPGWPARIKTVCEGVELCKN
jgi:hypothetical protein